MRYSFFIFLMILVGAFSSTTFAAGKAQKGKQIYQAQCIACHNLNPAKKGALGPAVKGASLKLLEFRIIKACYPKGYKPKRTTKMMPAMAHLKGSIKDITEFLK